jgi:serine/threonine protein kinase
MAAVLGKGSYGEVSVRDGLAVKKFAKLSHLIQEYTALQYLSDCKKVVKARGVNFAKLELHMELYDSSLRQWLEDERETRKVSLSDLMIIIRDILSGLVEIHDRQLAHGDLKPGNILIRRRPLGAVLGDCGFVSVAKYAKVERTAANYRDPIISHDNSHDMFSMGVCMLELLGDVKISRQATYDELRSVVNQRITDENHRNIISGLIHQDRTKRPSARDLLKQMFSLTPPEWVCPITTSPKASRILLGVLPDDREKLKNIMKEKADKYDIKRGKLGYGALLMFLDAYEVDREHYKLHVGVTLMVLSSIFGKSGFTASDALEICDRKYKVDRIYDALAVMLKSDVFLNILLLEK